MNYRTLGRTGITVSEVGFGAWAIGGNAHGNSYGNTNDADSKAAIRRALELGCTFFDTADVYGHGHSEELLGEALTDAGRNDDSVVIATKVGGNFYGGSTRLDFSEQHIRFAVEQSRQRLRRDVIDVYQLHNPSIGEIADGYVIDILEDLRAQGKIRAIGVSVFREEEALCALATRRIDTIQAVYNIIFHQIADSVFPLAQHHGLAIIAREPLANGFLTGKHSPEDKFFPGDIRSLWPKERVEAFIGAAEAIRFLEREGERTLAQAAIRFSLDDPAVAVSIPGAKTPAQVEENLAASAVPPISDEEWKRVQLTLFYRG